MALSIALPASVQYLLSRLNAAGFSAHAVGGCVRDALLGRSPQDWDLCTAARPEEITACFAAHRCILTGARYGTVTVLLDDTPFEITTYRAESGYSDGRHPDAVQFLRTLEGDLARRDFTINAMAADQSGSVTDLFDGLRDLKQGCIRCVGAPEARFSEDALRMLRALRFASRFSFSLEPETAVALRTLAPLLMQVAPERLSRELSGLLCGPAAAEVLDAFSDVITLLIPELKPCLHFAQYNPYHRYDVWTHLLHTLTRLPPQPVLRLAGFLHDVAKPVCFSMDKNLTGHFHGHAIAGAAMAEEILRRLRLDGRTIHTVCTLIRAHSRALPETPRAMRRLLAELGETDTRALLLLHAADRLAKGTEAPEFIDAQVAAATALLEQVLAEAQCFTLRELSIGGRELQALGFAPGPAMGHCLRALLDAVIDGRVPNERAALLHLAAELAPR